MQRRGSVLAGELHDRCPAIEQAALCLIPIHGLILSAGRLPAQPGSAHWLGEFTRHLTRMSRRGSIRDSYPGASTRARLSLKHRDGRRLVMMESTVRCGLKFAPDLSQ